MTQQRQILLPRFYRSNLPQPIDYEGCFITIVETNGAKHPWYSSGAAWVQADAAGSAGTLAGLSDITTFDLPANNGPLATALALFSSIASGRVPASGGGTTNFLRADGSWAAPPGGGAGVTDGDKGDIVVSGGGAVWSIDSSVLSTFSRTQLQNADAATWRANLGVGSGTGDVVGPAASVDSELAIYSGTTGKIVKRAVMTGIALLTAGVLSAAVAGTDYYAPAGTDVSVVDGGTGRSTSTTAYGLIAAGTTATGAHQTLAAGTTSQILVGGGAAALPVWTTASGTGAPVRATSPALVTPDLGVPTALTLTNATGLPVVGGGTGRATGTTAYALIATGTTATGAQQSLAAGATTEILVGGGAAALPVWTSATGTGAPVRATAPTITTLTASGILTRDGAERITATAMGADAIDVTKINNTKSFATDKTFTYSSVGTAGDIMGCTFSNTDTAAHVITMPANTIDYNTGITGTNPWLMPAGTKRKLLFESDGTNWTMMGSTSSAPLLSVDVTGPKTLALVDANVTQRRPASDTTGRTITIPANSSVPFPVGTRIPIPVEQGAGTTSVAITTDTLELAGSAATTGTRTIATGGFGILVKTAPTVWMLGGPGVT